MALHFILESILTLWMVGLLVAMIIWSRANRALVLFYPAILSIQGIDTVFNLVSNRPWLALAHGFLFVGFLVLALAQRSRD